MSLKREPQIEGEPHALSTSVIMCSSLRSANKAKLGELIVSGFVLHLPWQRHSQRGSKTEGTKNSRGLSAR